jgi:hypothetical protein
VQSVLYGGREDHLSSGKGPNKEDTRLDGVASPFGGGGHKVVLEDFVHSFNRGACDRVVVPVLRRPGSCPLMTRIPLVLRQVFAKLSLVSIVSE